jgi:DNA topoisomerase IB
MCRKSYVHPIVVARYLDDGETIALGRARRSAPDRGQAHSPEERALIAFLDRHFPERRAAPRDSIRGAAGKADPPDKPYKARR